MQARDFDAYYASRYDVLVGQMTALCGSRSEASDVVQEAFTRAWTHRRTFGRHPNLDAWIRKTARRLVIDGWRKRGRQVPLTDEPPVVWRDPSALLDLHRALQALPEKQRYAIVLHYLVDLPVADIATELDAQPSTVRVWLSRGRAALETLLTDQETHHA